MIICFVSRILHTNLTHGICKFDDEVIIPHTDILGNYCPSYFHDIALIALYQLYRCRNEAEYGYYSII